MPTVSVNIPEKMKKKLEEMAEEGMYQNSSEYIRDALREKINEDTGLTPEEEEEVLRRMKEVENGEVDLISEEEFKNKLDIE